MIGNKPQWGGDRLLSLTLWRQGTVVGDRRDRGRWSVLFTSGKYGDGDTTGLVSQEWLMKNGTTIDVKEYSYDDRGNIVSVVAGGKTTTYVYDDKNQLVRENNQALGKSYTYSYDSNGNLTSKKTYAYTTGALGSIISSQPFSYWDEGWGDLLSAFEGVEFTYDEIGNPLIYFNGEIYNFTWQKGRQLSSSTLLGNTYTYKYNQDGIRIEKTVGDKTHVYTLNGTRIEREIIKTGNTVVKDIYYYYDASGIISSAKILIHSGSTVTEYNLVFLTNMQGDVYEIYLDDGTKIASYNYDAWGNITTTYITTNTTLRQLADEAPFRYRGYYFDSETGFYYLNTRYYDPAICRFINADDISYLGANGDLQAYNLYAYCSNNPVMGYDPMGTWMLSIDLGASAWFITGVSIQRSIVIDSNMNFAVTESRIDFGPNSGFMVGLYGAEAGFSTTITFEGNVEDLEGKSFEVTAGEITVGMDGESITSISMGIDKGSKSAGIPLKGQDTVTTVVYTNSIQGFFEEVGKRIEAWWDSLWK